MAKGTLVNLKLNGRVVHNHTLSTNQVIIVLKLLLNKLQRFCSFMLRKQGCSMISQNCTSPVVIMPSNQRKPFTKNIQGFISLWISSWTLLISINSVIVFTIERGECSTQHMRDDNARIREVVNHNFYTIMAFSMVQSLLSTKVIRQAQN